jgi:phosphatidylserine/phosphatidylglycerophosphate/cardiolipin synthase-like enzyme
VEPAGDHGQALVDAIHAATKSIHMEMYLLTLDSVVSALAAKASAGLDVKVLLNETFPSLEDSNASVMSTLTRENVNARWASPAFAYTHEKAVIIDGRAAWIMTANATDSSYESNREYIAIDTDPTDVAEAEAIFEDDFVQSGYEAETPASTPTISGRLVVAPAPPMNSLPELVALITSAKKAVYAEVEEFDNASVANALVSAVHNGVSVDLVVANTSDNTSSNPALQAIRSGGGHVFIGGAPEGSSTAQQPYIHAKAIVVDGALAWVGSENFSTGSLEFNRELGVVFTGASEVAKVRTTIEKDVTGAVPF